MEINFRQSDLRQAAQLANTEAGKQLVELLSKQHSGQMQQLLSSIKSGDITQAKQSLANFLADPKMATLLNQLQEESHGRNGR